VERSSTAREEHLGGTFRTRSIEEVREIVDEVLKLQLPIDEVYKFADIGKVFEHMPTSTSARSW